MEKQTDIMDLVREELKKIGPFMALRLNYLADQFYQVQGYISQPGHNYLESKHPQEQRMFLMALLANRFFKEEAEGEEK